MQTILQILSVFLAATLVNSAPAPIGTKYTWQDGTTLPSVGVNASTPCSPGGRSSYSSCAIGIGLLIYGGYALDGPPDNTRILYFHIILIYSVFSSTNMSRGDIEKYTFSNKFLLTRGSMKSKGC
jgi:hypothetical protein